MPPLSPDERRKVEETARRQMRQAGKWLASRDTLNETLFLVNGDGTFCDAPPWPFRLSKQEERFLKAYHISRD